MCFVLKLLQSHQYETVSGFICEAFGYIPRTGESVRVLLEKAKREDGDDYSESGSDRKEQKDKQKNTHQIFRLEVF